MASTYSPLLRFELIGPGEQSGLWGNTTNSNIGTLIEQAVAGVTFVSLAGLSAYTLSTTNGTPDEQRSAVVVFSGVPTGAVTVTIPALQKVLVVSNTTNQSITLKTAAQVGGVVLASGSTMSVFCDGASVFSSIATLGIAYGGTGGTDQGSAQTALNVPSRTGTGASGTWPINISGNVTGSVANSTGVSPSMNSAINALMPAGTLLDFAGTSAPTGFLLCDGSAVSRTTYSALYAVLGTSWGAGDGSTTFNVPDLRGRTAIGAGTGVGLTTRFVAQAMGEEAHVTTTTEMPFHNHVINISDPGHTHGISDPGHAHSVNAETEGGTGRFATGGAGQYAAIATTTSGTGIGINGAFTGISASSNGVGGGAAHNNMQPSAVVLKIIKF